MYYMKEGHFFQRKKRKTSLFKKVIQVVCCTQDNYFAFICCTDKLRRFSCRNTNYCFFW